MNGLKYTAALIAAALLAQLACAESRSEADPCAGDAAPALGCVCLSGGECPKTTGLRLRLEAAGLRAPADFDALAIQAASDVFPPLRRNLDVFAGDLARRRAPGEDPPLKFPLDLLILAELPLAPVGPEGSPQAQEVELDVMATAYLCRSRAADTTPLSAGALEDCAATVQRLTGSSGRFPRTVTLRSEKIKTLQLTLEPVAGF